MTIQENSMTFLRNKPATINPSFNFDCAVCTVAILLFLSTFSRAQTLTLTTRFLNDNIPARIQQISSSLIVPISNSYSAQVGCRYFFVHQDLFDGIPQLRKTLYSLEAGLRARLLPQRVDLFAQGLLNLSPDIPPIADYLVRAQYSPSYFEDPGSEPFVTARLQAEAARHREVTVATALDEQISYKELSVQLDVSCRKFIEVAGKFARQYYSDENQKTIAYAYAVVQPISDPAISLGYAFAYSNSLFDNWRLTDTKRIAFNPITREITYQYSYFYYPYFTPIKEHGHILIGILQWEVIDHCNLYAKATIPFWSRGLMKYFPSTGNAPAPIDYGVYYDADDVQPKQYEASIMTDLINPLMVRLNFEYFEKPYYINRALGINIQYAFH
ncbi:MAG: hypothetical protein HYR77_12265 [Ignavibacteria bacterium]|nr:hypothetical protein [Ignavibacteria bacterium]